jgi:hypothetical protein
MRRHALALTGFVLSLSACTSILGEFSTEPASDGGIDGSAKDGGLDGSAKDGGHKDAAEDAKDAGHKDAAGDAIEESTEEASDDASEDASETSTGPTVTAVATGQTVYVGLPAKVDGLGSTASAGTLAYAWTVTSVPATSAIATASLSSTTSATATFVPDVAGAYKLRLRVTSDGADGFATVTVTAVAPQLFFLEGEASGDGGFNNADASLTLTYKAVDSNGQNNRGVICPEPSGYASVAPYLSGILMDSWEGEAGEPAKYVGFTLVTIDGGDGVASVLWSGTSASSCGASPPVSIGTFPEISSSTNSTAGRAVSPRFNSDGSRVAIYNPSLVVVTLAADGSNVHSVAPYFQGASVDAAAATFDMAPGNEPATSPPSPQWLGNKVAWARPSTAGWEIVTAADANGAAPANYMTCAGVVPREFRFLSDGTVVASFRQTSSGPENIYLLSNSTTPCTVLQMYTNLSNTVNAVATDFSVSPDEQWLAFVQIDPDTQDAGPWWGNTGIFTTNYGLVQTGGYVYVAPISNFNAAVQISPLPALYGPRWLGGGSLLAFTRLDPIPANGINSPTAAIVLRPDGGGSQAVASADGINNILATSGNGIAGACSVGLAPGRRGDRGLLALFSLIFAVPLVRRRRAVV